MSERRWEQDVRSQIRNRGKERFTESPLYAMNYGFIKETVSKSLDD